MSLLSARGRKISKMVKPRTHFLTGAIIKERLETEFSLNRRKGPKWVVGGLLGKSRVCDVLEFTEKKTNQAYAVKVTSKARMDPQEKGQYLAQLAVITGLRHHFLPEVQHYFENSEFLFVFFPLYSAGSLKDLLQRRGRLQEVEVAVIAKQLL